MPTYANICQHVSSEKTWYPLPKASFLSHLSPKQTLRLHFSGRPVSQCYGTHECFVFRLHSGALVQKGETGIPWDTRWTNVARLISYSGGSKRQMAHIFCLEVDRGWVQNGADTKLFITDILQLNIVQLQHTATIHSHIALTMARTPRLAGAWRTEARPRAGSLMMLDVVCSCLFMFVQPFQIFQGRMEERELLGFSLVCSIS